MLNIRVEPFDGYELYKSANHSWGWKLAKINYIYWENSKLEPSSKISVKYLDNNNRCDGFFIDAGQSFVDAVFKIHKLVRATKSDYAKALLLGFR